MVVWEQDVIRAARVTAGSASVPVALSFGPGERPTVARDEDGFAVAWLEGDNLRGLRLSRELVASPPVTLSGESLPLHGPHAWTALDGTARFAYPRFAAITEWVPQMYVTEIGTAPPRQRAVRR
jgi:hypothetical protein